MRAGSSATTLISPRSRRRSSRNSASAGRCGLPTKARYIFALIAGLIIANFLPRFAAAIKEAVRPELYIKVAIVILGDFFAVTAAGKLSLASSLVLRGLAAIAEAYLIYWAVVYFVARKWFGFSARVGGAARLRHLDLRRVGGDRHRRRHPRAAARAGAGILAGRGVRGHRGAGAAVRLRSLARRTSRWSPAPGWGSRSRPTAPRSRPAGSPNH